jgi:hypothetical protein
VVPPDRVLGGECKTVLSIDNPRENEFDNDAGMVKEEPPTDVKLSTVVLGEVEWTEMLVVDDPNVVKGREREETPSEVNDWVDSPSDIVVGARGKEELLFVV